jgi:hypothetical protein
MKKHIGKILIMALATITAIIYFIFTINIEYNPSMENNVASEEDTVIMDSIAESVDTLGVEHLEKKETSGSSIKKPVKGKSGMKNNKSEKESKEEIYSKPKIIEREAQNEID